MKLSLIIIKYPPLNCATDQNKDGFYFLLTLSITCTLKLNQVYAKFVSDSQKIF